MLSACCLAMLTGCGTLRGIVSRPPPPPPVPPADLVLCFEKTVGVPGKRGTALTSKQATGLILALYSLDREKSQCGKRVLRFYGVKV